MLKSVGLVQPSVSDQQRKSTKEKFTIAVDSTTAATTTINSTASSCVTASATDRNHNDNLRNNNNFIINENKKCKQCYIKAKIKLKDYVDCNHNNNIGTSTVNGFKKPESFSWSRNEYQK